MSDSQSTSPERQPRREPVVATPEPSPEEVSTDERPDRNQPYVTNSATARENGGLVPPDDPDLTFTASEKAPDPRQGHPVQGENTP